MGFATRSVHQVRSIEVFLVFEEGTVFLDSKAGIEGCILQALNVGSQSADHVWVDTMLEAKLFSESERVVVGTYHKGGRGVVAEVDNHLNLLVVLLLGGHYIAVFFGLFKWSLQVILQHFLVDLLMLLTWHVAILIALHFILI